MINKLIDKMQKKALWPALGTIALGFALTGCGQNTASETTTGTTTTGTTTQAAKDDHAHAPGEAPHAHEGDATKTGAAGGDNHDAEIEATVTKFFPGATLKKKPFPFSTDAAAHLGEDAGVKFTGNENKWQVFEATRDGQRVGMAVMTHSALPNGKDMHVAFAVNPKFVVTHVTALDAPDNAKMQEFVKQIVGKKLSAPFKVGQALKAPAGLTPQVAQISADAIKKGLAILDSNFNAAHGHDAAPAEAPHDESVPHEH